MAAKYGIKSLENPVGFPPPFSVQPPSVAGGAEIGSGQDNPLEAILSGMLTILGDAIIGNGGVLESELSSTTPGVNDLITVSGNVDLSGKLRVLLLNGFTPQLGNTFEVLNAGSISGQFSNYTFPALTAGMHWGVAYSPHSVTLSIVTAAQAGDYNNDGLVNGLDYNFWRASFGTTNAAADGNGSGLVDAADYLVWRKHATSTATATILAAVPEPSTWSLVLLLGACILASRKRLRAD